MIPEDCVGVLAQQSQVVHADADSDGMAVLRGGNGPDLARMLTRELRLLVVGSRSLEERLFALGAVGDGLQDGVVHLQPAQRVQCLPGDRSSAAPAR